MNPPVIPLLIPSSGSTNGRAMGWGPQDPHPGELVDDVLACFGRGQVDVFEFEGLHRGPAQAEGHDRGAARSGRFGESSRVGQGPPQVAALAVGGD